eukprot:TRINITY_DN7961_c0_g1_i1.p1 TRINITY_DN7961_c0_g1~~TRINITY_DN7961_c0_g1_i1.p1  ORF type:complete len:214 (+),score=74.02 TRINITY_DN7961_c0_g1_i1:96-644(+)
MSEIEDRIIWVDLEMTGLNLDKDQIIEMACIITDGQLNVVAESPNLVIHASDDLLNSMDNWCTKQHGSSGLTQACRESTVSLQDAEKIMTEFIQAYTKKRVAPIAGSSVHVDRQFLAKQMPSFTNWLTYRIIDVSTVKQLCYRWYPGLSIPTAPGNHRALDDIKASIESMRFMREKVFKENI